MSASAAASHPAAVRVAVPPAEFSRLPVGRTVNVRMVRSAPLARRLLLALIAVALLGPAVLVAPVAAADPAPAAAAKPFRMNVYRDGDFVSQTNLVQCVGASMQMMLNMMRPKDNRSAAYQLELQNLARKWSPRFANGTEANGQVRQRRGASSRGWAFGLTKLGYGRYRVTSGATLEEAVTGAAIAMRKTGRPVGLLVWRGAHAWVMSGFEATGDVLRDPTARVTHVYVQDPLFPRVSSVWGRSPKPNTRLTLEQMGRPYVPWRPNSTNGMAGRFVFVEPLVDWRTAHAATHRLD